MKTPNRVYPIHDFQPNSSWSESCKVNTGPNPIIFQIRTIQKPNLKTFGIGMALGIPSSDFEPPLYSIIAGPIIANVAISIMCSISYMFNLMPSNFGE